MTVHLYHGAVLGFSEDTPAGWALMNDGVVSVDGDGMIEQVRCEIGDSLPNRQTKNNLENPVVNVILPGTVNAHDHSFQPPGIPGELIRRNERDSSFEGWLPTTLRIGEVVAKNDISLAHAMAIEKFQAFARNGISRSLQYTTSSLEGVKAVLVAGQEIGIDVVAGYVAMDQNVANIQQVLEEHPDRIIDATRALLDEYGHRHIAVIDRFPIAVSSITRRKLADLARLHGALYETHLDESVSEKNIHREIYGTKSIVETLCDDGVFQPGSKVGIAHCIHTSLQEIDLIAKCINEGCTVFVRACPDSNSQLASHWDEQGNYVRFPLKEWKEAGALITIGTDHGAGRTPKNIFLQMLLERGRHPIAEQPTYLDLLTMGIKNALFSLGREPSGYNIATGNRANFVVVRLEGSSTFYCDTKNVCASDMENIAARTIEAGADGHNVVAHWVDGKRVK